MTTTKLEAYRKKLLALRDRLTGDVSFLANEALGQPGEENGGNLSHVPIHLADLGTDSFEQQFTLALLANEAQVLEEIDAALDRLDRGTFGYCEGCQKAIAHERLQALPYARQCVACADKSPGEAAERS
jgi:DnaK suppressor protein